MASRVAVVGVLGPLAEHAEGFRAELLAQGYSPLSAANQLRLMAHLSRWLTAEGVGPVDLTPERVDAFLEHRRTAGYTCWRSRRGLEPLLGYLGGLGLLPTPVAPVRRGALEQLLERYEAYLIKERGILASTAGQYRATARRFLSGRQSGSDLRLQELSAAEVVAFLKRECAGRSVGSAKLVVTHLRAVLRFLHQSGYTATPLMGAVPAVAGWRLSGVPKALEPGQVDRLLASCDRARPVGRRDYTMVLLAVRLGLRAGEVAALCLDDIDWRGGEVVIRGKGRRDERLPLPADVGEALAEYLHQDRRRAQTRRVFLRVMAPQGPLGAGGVKAAVAAAAGRAGMERVGAHRLRHSAATQTLRAGASLAEVGQLLRHRHPSTTAIYAKVDLVSLGLLAPPWPRPTSQAVLQTDLAVLVRPWPGRAA